ncbi:MAG: hypothetical protein K0S45_155 [Nitrospira sp.]|jgi:hypothetical protein|nr:hypothetical protein [Nitrospira sp.]
MPAYILGALAILFCMIAVWASVTQESAPMMGEEEPDWDLEPLNQPEEYRKQPGEYRKAG